MVQRLHHQILRRLLVAPHPSVLNLRTELRLYQALRRLLMGLCPSLPARHLLMGLLHSVPHLLITQHL